MKKFLLIALGCASISGTANAQAFTTQKDTVAVTYVLGSNQLNIDNLISNPTNSPVTIQWKTIANNIPADWRDGAQQPNPANNNNQFGICDNVICYSSTATLNASSVQTTAAYPANSTGGAFHVQLTLGTAATQGTYYATVNLTSGSTSKNVTFVVTTANPTGVTNVNKSSDDVQLYPNPAHNSVNVVFDPNAGVKYISVYNLIGKPVSTFRVNGGSAQLDISDIPAGVYFVRLMDAQSHVLDTRKFTRQ